MSANFLMFSQEIQNQDFSSRRSEAEAELNKANALLLKMSGFSVPVYNQSKAFEALRAKIQNFDDRLIDLNDRTLNVVETANNAEALNSANNDSKVVSTVEKVKNLTQEANSTLEDASELLRNASALLRDAGDAFDSLNLETQQRQNLRDRLNETLVTNQLELFEVQKPLQEAEAHVLKLEAKVGVMIVIMCPLKVHNHQAFIGKLCAFLKTGGNNQYND
jgi:Laminin Domain I.